MPSCVADPAVIELRLAFAEMAGCMVLCQVKTT